MGYEEKLNELGFELPQVAKPVAAYVPAVRTGNLVFTSGQLPVKDGKLICTGKVGRDCDRQQAYDAARVCVLNALAAIKGVIGSLEEIEQVVKVVGYVQSADDFYEQPAVINGASEFLQRIFDEKGAHCRCAIGVNALPLNAAVEVEVMVRVKS